MGKILQRANDKIAEKLGIEAVERRTNAFVASDSDIFTMYENMMEEKKPMQMQFSACDRDGTFSSRTNDGILIIMSSSDTLEGFPYFEAYFASLFLGYSYEVLITRVDRENKRVYVKSARNGQFSSKKNCIHEIINELEKGNKPKVWGKIVSVREDKAFVDILGMHILGIVDRRHWHWKKGFTRRIDAVCHPGEFYEFEITHKCARKPGKDQAFLLERRNLAENPWEQVPRDIVKRGAIIRVKCVDIPEGKSYWWGVSDIAPGIEIVCDFPKTDNPIRVFSDITYKCRVKSFAVKGIDGAEKNTFRVACTDVSDEAAEEYAQCMKFLNEKVLEEYAQQNATDSGEDATEQPIGDGIQNVVEDTTEETPNINSDEN